jgi:hypothetical protein
MPKTVYDRHGNPTTAHEHKWVQSQLTIWPTLASQAPIPGVTVTWRCSKRGCAEIYQKEVRFRRPSKSTAGNSWSQPVPPMMEV